MSRKSKIIRFLSLIYDDSPAECTANREYIIDFTHIARFFKLFAVFMCYFLISCGAYINRPMPCAKNSSAKKFKLAVMELPAYGITCVNVTVSLAPNVTVEGDDEDEEGRRVRRSLVSDVFI